MIETENCSSLRINPRKLETVFRMLLINGKVRLLIFVLKFKAKYIHHIHK